jgi:3-methylcrotonyl-CoA carboxylase alpha subunit
MSGPVTPLGNGRYLVQKDARRQVAYAVVDGSRVWVFLSGRVTIVDTDRTAQLQHGRPDHDAAQALAAPMPATVASIAVKPGDRVSRGDVLVTLEAMKMELPITAPHDGVVKAVSCREGELVQPGVPLLELE